MVDPSIQMPEKTILTKPGGLKIELLNYGATLRSIHVPVAGKQLNVLLSYPADEDYLKDRIYLGSTLGRYAGRIDSGVARLKGRSIQLARNEHNSGHCLHGGSQGFSHQFWSLREQTTDSVSYEHVSADGDQGFPGRLITRVSYRMPGPMSLQIEYTAETDQETIVNLGNHAYFNLNSTNSGVENHEIMINADLYAPLKKNSIPTGETRHVADTAFDFRKKARLGQRLNTADSQLHLAGGYDHYFLLNKSTKKPDIAALVHSPESGITMRLYTDQPGVQFYSGNSLIKPFGPHAGLCLEFQDVPNEPNMDGFPSTVLRPGEVYRRQITLEFESESGLK